MKGVLEFDWTAELPAASRERVLGSMTERTFRSGELFYSAGDLPGYAYQIRSGRASIYTIDESGRRFLLKFYVPGEWAGSVSLIDGETHTVFAEAVGEVRAGVIRRAEFEKLRADDPAIERALTQQLARALRRTVGFWKDATLRSVEARVASRLLWMIEGEGRVLGDGVRIVFAQDDLGSMVGASRQTVNRTIGQMKEAGLIEVGYGALVVKDCEGLGRLARPN